MRHSLILYIFLSLSGLFSPVWGEITAKEEDWQEQILQRIDPEEFSETQYAHLLEMLEEFSLHNNDTNYFHTKNQLIWRSDRCLNTRAGFKDITQEKQENNKAYLGNPWHQTLRYSIERADQKQHRWRLGVVLDKDAGEDWRNSLPFADSFNMFAAYSSRSGVLRDVIFGHYRIQLGSGLILNQQFTMGKNLIGSEFMRQTPRLSPHASAAESGHMQGAAIRLRLNRHLEILPFVSAQQIDGSLKNDTLTSWTTDGYHRTTTEAGKRNQCWLTNLGMRVQSMGEWWEVGLNAMYSMFQHDYVRSPRKYNQNYFKGHELIQTSFDYRLQILGFQMRGEFAMDDSKGFASINGLYHTLGNSWNLTALHRYYSNTYRQIWGSAMAESSGMQGEQGASVYLDGSLNHGWNLQASADYWHFSQATYSCYLPSSGYELSGRALWSGEWTHVPVNFNIRYRFKAKEKNNTSTKSDDKIGFYKQSLDATFQIEPLDGLQLRSQARLRFYSEQGKNESDHGIAFSEALIWKRENCPIKGEIQGAWFKAEEYECRIYLTERNILYGYNLPMLYGEGVRYSFTLSYKISERILAEAKYALTNYRNKTSISSGLQAIEGNTKHDLWLQLRAKF